MSLIITAEYCNACHHHPAHKKKTWNILLNILQIHGNNVILYVNYVMCAWYKWDTIQDAVASYVVLMLTWRSVPTMYTLEQKKRRLDQLACLCMLWRHGEGYANSHPSRNSHILSFQNCVCLFHINVLWLFLSLLCTLNGMRFLLNIDWYLYTISSYSVIILYWKFLAWIVMHH